MMRLASDGPHERGGFHVGVTACVFGVSPTEPPTTQADYNYVMTMLLAMPLFLEGEVFFRPLSLIAESKGR